MINKFEELIAWQKSRELVSAIYKVTNGKEFSRDFGLRDQIQRAAVSIMSNIAEGFERAGRTEGDIRDLELCRKLSSGIDFILHQAALGSVPRSLADPVNFNDNNITGTLNMLVAARECKVRRFVYASSSSVYGDNPTLPKVEDAIGAPLSPYAVTKYVSELYAGVFSRCYGTETVGLRYFNVFGPRQDPNGAYAAVIPKWIADMIQGNPVYINGTGETSRDFCSFSVINPPTQ